MAEFIRLVHPETGGEFEAAVEAVAGWEALGWQKADSVKKKEAPSA